MMYRYGPGYGYGGPMMGGGFGLFGVADSDTKCNARPPDDG